MADNCKLCRIALENVSVVRGGQTLLQDVSMHIHCGQLTVLIGQNGAGKTTLLRHLTGVYRQDEGSVRFDGEEVWENAGVKARIASIPDDWFYFMQAGLRDMMRFYRGLYPKFDQERFEKLREVFALDEKRPLRRMSKGQQKQAAFWLAMCTMPDYLILDEPVDGLDPVMRRQVWSLILQDVAERGTTVLVSSHNLRELEDVCDHVGVMSRGKLLLEHSLSELQDYTVKLQLAFEGAELPALPQEIKVLHHAQTGRVHTLICRGSAEELEQQLAALCALACAGDVFKQPVHLRAGEIGVDDEAGLGPEAVRQALGLQAVAVFARAAALPDDSVVDGLACDLVPDDGGFALVGDADGRDVGGSCADLLHGLDGYAKLRSPDLICVVLDPAGFRKVLGEFALRDAAHFAALIEENAAIGSRAGVQGHDVFCHEYVLLIFLAD